MHSDEVMMGGGACVDQNAGTAWRERSWAARALETDGPAVSFAGERWRGRGHPLPGQRYYVLKSRGPRQQLACLSPPVRIVKCARESAAVHVRRQGFVQYQGDLVRPQRHNGSSGTGLLQPPQLGWPRPMAVGPVSAAAVMRLDMVLYTQLWGRLPMAGSTGGAAIVGASSIGMLLHRSVGRTLKLPVVLWAYGGAQGVWRGRSTVLPVRPAACWPMAGRSLQHHLAYGGAQVGRAGQSVFTLGAPLLSLWRGSALRRCSAGGWGRLAKLPP